MEGKVTVGRRAAALALLAFIAGAGGCREVITDDDTGPPGSGAQIAWEPAGPPGEAILALRVTPNGVLYAGSGSGKLFRSVTDGDQWTAMALPFADGAVTAIIVDPLERIFVSNDVHGILLSIDGGATWTRANAGLTDTSIYAMAYTPGGTLVAGSARGTVSTIAPGSAVWTERFTLARPVTSLQAVSSQEIFAAAWGSGVFRFGPADSGAVSVNPGLQDLYLNVIYSGPAGYLYAGTRSAGLFRSDPGSIFWESAGGGSISREVIALRTSSFGELFAGTATGVYISTDEGLHWSRLDGGIGAQEVRALAADGNARVFAGTVDGVYRSVRSE